MNQGVHCASLTSERKPFLRHVSSAELSATEEACALCENKQRPSVRCGEKLGAEASFTLMGS